MRGSNWARLTEEMNLVVAHTEDLTRRLAAAFAGERDDKGGDPLGLELPIDLEALCSTTARATAGSRPSPDADTRRR